MQDIDMMEYCDDVRHFEEHGHAACEAYAMATSLASDIAHHIRQVVSYIPAEARVHSSLAHPTIKTP